jgi:plasmid stability protein
MPSIQIKNVPDEVHSALRRRAGATGQSLQEYLLAELTRVAGAPTMSEVLERVRHRSDGRLTLRAAAADVRADRDQR